GGGYVRIVSLQLEEDTDIQDALSAMVGESLSQNNSEGLTAYLYQQGIISQREMALLNGILKDRVLVGMDKQQRDHVRASMMQQTLAMLNMLRQG
ncbi:MAG: hypothetical protein IIV02_05675, partial [Peptococcaceae bacterium]|nr:hypothetical protein [Peptococcaceae bacterium]